MFSVPDEILEYIDSIMVKRLGMIQQLDLMEKRMNFLREELVNIQKSKDLANSIEERKLYVVPEIPVVQEVPEAEEVEEEAKEEGPNVREMFALAMKNSKADTKIAAAFKNAYGNDVQEVQADDPTPVDVPEEQTVSITINPPRFSVDDARKLLGREPIFPHRRITHFGKVRHEWSKNSMTDYLELCEKLQTSQLAELYEIDDYKVTRFQAYCKKRI